MSKNHLTSDIPDWFFRYLAQKTSRPFVRFNELKLLKSDLSKQLLVKKTKNGFVKKSIVTFTETGCCFLLKLTSDLREFHCIYVRCFSAYYMCNGMIIAQNKIKSAKITKKLQKNCIFFWFWSFQMKNIML